jgi:hypothetical protein
MMLDSAFQQSVTDWIIRLMDRLTQQVLENVKKASTLTLTCKNVFNFLMTDVHKVTIAVQRTINVCLGMDLAAVARSGMHTANALVVVSKLQATMDRCVLAMTARLVT